MPRISGPSRPLRIALTIVAVLVIGFPVYYTLLGSILPPA